MMVNKGRGLVQCGNFHCDYILLTIEIDINFFLSSNDI
jgi:hypothetical protein